MDELRSGSPKNVLVVEDDSSVRRMLNIVLRRVGFQVIEAASGMEAIGILETQSPDGVVLDLGLSDGLGAEVLQRLKGAQNRRGHPAWIALSALSLEEATSLYGTIGSNFMAKPFNPWDLVEYLKKLLK